MAASVPPSDCPMRNGCLPRVRTGDFRDTCGDGLTRILIETGMSIAGGRCEPFENIDVQAVSQTVAHSAH